MCRFLINMKKCLIKIHIVTRDFMLNHQQLHTGEFKECICDLCGAVYKSVQVLNKHKWNVQVKQNYSRYRPMP